MNKRLLLVILGSIFLLYSVLVIYYSWVSSDGFAITFQSYNVLNGFGLVWNYGERCFVSTSPIFTILSIVLTFFLDPVFNLLDFGFKKLYYLTLIINLLFSFSAFVILLNYIFKKRDYLNNSKLLIIIGLILWAFASKYYLLFSTSGFENPLSYLVLSFFTIFTLSENKRNRLFYLPVIIALAFLCRYDFFIILFPQIVFLLYTNKLSKGNILMALIPITWMVFALFYFGSFMPNSYYVKTTFNLDYSIYFLLQNINKAPLLFMFLFVGLMVTFKNSKSIFIGCFLYFLYIIFVTDYIYGRLFTVLIPIFLINLIYFVLRGKSRRYMVINIGFVSILITVLGIWCNYSFEQGRFTNQNKIYRITDTSKNFNKFNYVYNQPSQNFDTIMFRIDMLHQPILKGNEKNYFLDPVGLSQPFMAHSSKKFGNKGNRPGHYQPSFTDKELEDIKMACLQKNSDFIKNENHKELFDDVNLVTSGALWDINRIKTIIKLNTHNYNE